MPKKDLALKNDLEEMVKAETASRAVLTAFITSHMKEKTDFGSIMIKGKLSKPSLFKAGAEKFASLMKLRADCERDNDTWEMAGSKPGLFCYKCRLYDKGGNEVGMGLGACDVAEKSNYNSAIKIAKKRAFVDAILTTGALSDFFTQDLEDLTDNPVQTKITAANSETYQASDKQLWLIRKLLDEKGYSEHELKGKYEISELGQLSKEQASTIIENLTKLEARQTELKEADFEEIDKALV